jgi:hypothetical protein
MRLIDDLRKAEQKGLKVVRQGVVRAKEEWGDVERRIRRRMRIYPQKLLGKKGMVAAPEPQELQPEIPPEAPPETEKHPVVSVHGRRIEDDDLSDPAA